MQAPMSEQTPEQPETAAHVREKSEKTLLVVDDEPEIRWLISDFLSDIEGYRVIACESGVEALGNVLPEESVDLVLSDINMPQMKGFDLLCAVRDRYPHIKRVLITAYNVEDYLELALKHDVGNIFSKTTPFNFEELSALVDNLLSGNIFGPQRYFGANAQCRTREIVRGDHLDQEAEEIISLLPEPAKSRKLQLVLVELLTNAIFYGIRKENPAKKENWKFNFVLPPEDAVKAEVMWDEEKYAVSIVDTGGNLSKNDYLYWLHRQSSCDEAGMPIGILDTHGRGFYIARKYIDRLIINIDRNRKTEVVMINYYDDNRYIGSKPLHINEL